VLRWGILGCGKIAHHFAKDLKLLDGHVLQAVASRTLDKANEFGGKFGVHNCYGNYFDLLEDEDVDVVYIATPHNSHMDWSIEAMNRKKHVLCEKPLAVNNQQVRAMITSAQANNVFLMEALCSRFNPTIKEVKKRCESGVIGKLKHLYAEFSFCSSPDHASRLYDPLLAGGALLDVGIYPVFLAYILFGYPEKIKVISELGETGVDLQSSIALKFPEGQATLFCGITCDAENHAILAGTKGRFVIPSRWHEAQGYVETIDGSEKQNTLPVLGRGYTYEIEEVKRCISCNWRESPVWSHEDSLNLCRILDEIREQIGLSYPFE